MITHYPAPDIYFREILFCCSSNRRHYQQLLRRRNDTAFAFVEGSNTGIPVDELQKKEAPVPESEVKLNPNAGNTSQIPPLKTPLLGVNMRQKTFTLNEGGEILIQFPSQFNEDSFQDFTDWLELLHRKIGRNVQGTNKPKLIQKNDKDTH